MKEHQLPNFRRNTEGYRNPEDFIDPYNEKDKRVEDLRTAIEYLRRILNTLVSIEQVDVSDKGLFRKLAENNQVSPELKLYAGIRARSWLKKNRLIGNKTTAPYAIAVFNFPPPIAQNWNVGYLKSDEYEQYTQGALKTEQVPWANIYGEKLRTLWNIVALMEYGLDEENEANLKGLGFDTELIHDAFGAFQKVSRFGVRINAPREHDPETYYYVWGWYE